MKRTGEILRQAREAKGLSINELALSLKINSKALTAIEEGDLSKLPARTFLRGFVQSYAQALKIDVDEVLGVFAEEMGTTRPQPMPAPSATAPNVPGPLPANPLKAVPDTPVAPPIASPAMSRVPVADGGLKELQESNRLRIVLFSSLVVVLVMLIIGTKKVIDRYQREKETAEIVVSNPLEHAPDETPEATETEPPASAEKPVEKTVETSAEKPADPAAEKSSPPVEKAKPSIPVSTFAPLMPTNPIPMRSESPAMIMKKAPPPPPAETKPAEPEKPEEPAKPAVAEEKKPAEPAKPAPKKSIELIIEALDSVDVEYVGGTGPSQKIRLEADQVHTIRSKSGLKLTVSNGGAVNLILNGRDIGVPGGLGSPATLTY